MNEILISALFTICSNNIRAAKCVERRKFLGKLYVCREQVRC